MTNKEKLEIIDKKLEMLYENLSRNKWVTDYANDITQAIYNLESTKLLLVKPIQNYIFPIDGIPDPDENYFKRKNFIV